MRPSVKAAKSIARRLSVRLCPVPTIYSKSESRRNFKFGTDMTLDTSNRESKFEVKRSSVKVTVNENAKKSHKFVHVSCSFLFASETQVGPVQYNILVTCDSTNATKVSSVINFKSE